MRGINSYKIHTIKTSHLLKHRSNDYEIAFHIPEIAFHVLVYKVSFVENSSSEID